MTLVESREEVPRKQPPNVSIGILAYNEEGRIAATLRSLLCQSVFLNTSHRQLVGRVEIVVVPNGCTDQTEAVALSELAAQAGTLELEWLSFHVVPLIQPGKSRAWNCYIHDIANPDTDFFVMIDADIEFGHPDTLANSIRLLSESSTADVVVDTPLKDFARKPRKSALEWLSLRISSTTLADPQRAAIAGSFYCARAKVLKSIWMPPGLSGEDGFLRALVVTDLCRSSPENYKVIRAINASHYFEGLKSLRAIFLHEVRLIIGTTFNCYLTWDFLIFAVPKDSKGAGDLIRRLIESDPHWYERFINNQIQSRGWWKLPNGMFLRRFRRVHGKKGKELLVHYFIASVTFLVDVPTLLYANHLISKRRAIGFW